jgi:hypothetical protein
MKKICFLALGLAACSSVQFKPFTGNETTSGKGGVYDKTVGGVEFYDYGLPHKKNCRIIGVLHGRLNTVLSIGSSGHGDKIAKAAVDAGANALVLAGNGLQSHGLVGIGSSGSLISVGAAVTIDTNKIDYVAFDCK